MISKIDQLFIRACKSSNPDKRLRSIYRRFYLKASHEDETIYISNHLVYLVDKYFTLSIGEYLRRRSGWLMYFDVAQEVASDHQITLWVMRGYLAYGVTLDDCFKVGIPKPAMFRNKEK